MITMIYIRKKLKTQVQLYDRNKIRDELYKDVSISMQSAQFVIYNAKFVDPEKKIDEIAKTINYWNNRQKFHVMKNCAKMKLVYFILVTKRSQSKARVITHEHLTFLFKIKKTLYPHAYTKM